VRSAMVQGPSGPATRGVAAVRSHAERGNEKALRLGIWCDYDGTLTTAQGIGVFVHNLVAALPRLGEPVEVVLAVRPGDRDAFAGLARQTDRVRIVPPPSSPLHRVVPLLRTAVRWLDQAHAAKRALFRPVGKLGPALLGRLRRLRTRARQRRPTALLLLA